MPKDYSSYHIKAVTYRFTGRNPITVSFVAAFISIFFFNVPLPVIIVSARLIGYRGSRIEPEVFTGCGAHGSAESAGERLRGNRSLNGALSAITAAILSVVLNLAVWFAFNTIFGSVSQEQSFGVRLLIPVWSSLSIPSLAIGAFAMVALFRLKPGMISCIVSCALLAIMYNFGLSWLG